MFVLGLRVRREPLPARVARRHEGVVVTVRWLFMLGFRVGFRV